MVIFSAVTLKSAVLKTSDLFGELFRVASNHEALLKFKGVAYLLWLVSGFGWLGLHRFYLGKIGTGLDLASRTQGVSKAEYWAAILLNLAGDDAMFQYSQPEVQGKQEQLPWSIFWNPKIDELSQEYGLDEAQKQAIKKALMDFVQKPLSADGQANLNPYDVYAKGAVGKAIFDKRSEELVSASNQLSLDQVRKDLIAAKKSKAVFLIGNSHHALVEALYRSPPELSKFLAGLSMSIAVAILLPATPQAQLGAAVLTTLGPELLIKLSASNKTKSSKKFSKAN